MLDLGHRVDAVNTRPTPDMANLTLLQRAEYKLFQLGIRGLGRLPDITGANARMRDLAEGQNYDVIWIDKGLTIDADTLHASLKRNPRCILVGYSPDDMGVPHGQSRQFLEHLPLYDIFFTTKSYNVQELRDLGCQRVEFVGNAYDPHTHRPVDLTPEERRELGGPVGFIGGWESERAESLYRLAREGVNVRVWGGGWASARQRHPNLRLECKEFFDERYPRAISAFDINFCFLRKKNRDLQTTRSVEIPACGKFMLAERTVEHCELFQEGVEAEFFDSFDELREKVAFYLRHDQIRERVGRAGLVRCERSGYSNHDRLKRALEAAVSLR